MALRVINLIFCIVCYKWRHLSNHILFLECLLRMVGHTIPNAINENKSVAVSGQEFGLIFVTFYCDTHRHIFALCLALAYVIFVPPVLLYLRSVTISFIFINILTILVLFVATTLCGMVIIYITQLHAQLEFSNKENVKLLDGMHEGLLIFNTGDSSDHTRSKFAQAAKKKIMFCNSPARKLFMTFMGSVKVGRIFSSHGFTPLRLNMVDNESLISQ